MDRDDLYVIYQENLLLLENMMKQVKKMVQINLGKLKWEEKNDYPQGQRKKTENDILGGTRLYTFLLCSWLEVRLNKILHENSSVAFSDAERIQINAKKSMAQKWEKCFNIAVGKSYHFADSDDYTNQFTQGSDEQKLYIYVKNLLRRIENAIIIRNRLAHGQWQTQLNSGSNGIANADVTDFFQEYDNIQKLDCLYESFKLIASIISDYVVYKDKCTTDNFKTSILEKKKKIQNLEKAIAKRSFEKYCNPFYIKERKKHDQEHDS